MNVDATIGFFRRVRPQTWRCTLRVTRLAAAGGFDEVTGLHDPDSYDTVYEGPGNVRERKWKGVEVVTGEREISQLPVDILLPHDTAVLEDDVVEVLTAPHDASLVGQRYRLTDVHFDAWQVTRECEAERIAREPEEEESS